MTGRAEELAARVRQRMADAATPVTPAAIVSAVRADPSAAVLGDTAVLRIADRVHDELVGAGPLAPLLEDPQVTDVLVNGVRVWVDRGAGLRQVAVPLGTVDDVRRLAQRLTAAAGRRLDDGSPYADARLPDGTRLHAVLPPVATDGPYLSLRTFRHRPFTLDELVQRGTVPRPVAPVLAALVAARLAYLVVGGTGSGKTTLLNTMLGLVPATERIVLVEDAAELRPVHPHVVGLQVRTANVEGAGVVGLSELVRQALRMRPDRLVVGECRGAEVVDLLAALNTGHDGGAGTLHANTPADVPARLEALGMLGGLPRAALHAQVTAALQVLVQVRRGRHGRLVESICLLLPQGADRLVTVVPAWVRGQGVGPAWPALATLLQDRGAPVPPPVHDPPPPGGGAGMTAGSWLVVALLAGAALVVVWPVRSSRRRRRRVLGPPPDAIGSPVSASLMRAIGWTSLRGRASLRGRTGFVGVPGPTGSIGTGLSTGATGDDPDRSASVGRRALWRMTAARPRRVVLLVGFVGAGTGGLTAGPVAAALLAGYGMLAARAVYRRREAGRIVRERRRRLDRLGAFAADLRAGLPAPTLDPTATSAAADLLGGPGPTPAFGIRSAAGRRPGAGPSAPPTAGTRSPPPAGGRAGSSGVPAGFPPAPRPGEVTPGDDPTGTDRLERLARSAVRLADRTGAPLAELLERVEADARAFDRGLAGAAAQAAGANATALLLAGLPLGGIALGYGIGVDPLAVLLHTPVGAGCALAAMGLQAGGLLWAERLGVTPGGSG